ncbi:MAG: D-alanine--D-alanine ligase [Rhodothermales bacterium]
MRIGLVYDTFDAFPWEAGDPLDADAEYEPEATVAALEAAVRRLGAEPVRIGTAHDLLASLGQLRLDAAISIAEGARSRNREAYAPILFEMAGIPFLGSDALTLSVSLDKAWTKDLVAAAGVPTPAYRCYRDAGAIDPADLPGPFPLFVKPRYEGSSKGITHAAKAETVDALRHAVSTVTAAYRQDALVEPFVSGGGEFTVAIVGNAPAEPLPVLQRAVERTTRIGLHALDRRGYAHDDLAYDLEGRLDDRLERRLQDLAVRAYDRLGCLDFARVDFRVDHAGDPWFLEINPLPTFDPEGTFAIVAELMGQSYEDFLSEVLGRALRRVVG